MACQAAVAGRRAGGVHELAAPLLLLVIVALFGAVGFVVHALWFVLVAAVVLWIVGVFLSALRGGSRPVGHG